MAKSKVTKFAKKQTGMIIAIGGLAIVLGLAVYAFSDRQRLYSKLEDKVFGSGGSSSGSSDDDSDGTITPETQSDNSGGLVQQSKLFLDRLQQPQTYSFTSFQYPQASVKPVTSTAVANYSRIIQDAINSGYTGLGEFSSRKVSRNNIQSSSSQSASSIRRSQQSKSNNNVQSKEQQAKSGVSKYLTNYKQYTSSNNTTSSRNNRASRYSSLEKSVKSSVSTSLKKYNSSVNSSSSGKRTTKPRRIF